MKVINNLIINDLVYDLETIDGSIFIAGMPVNKFYDSLDFGTRLKLAKIAMSDNRIIDQQLKND